MKKTFNPFMSQDFSMDDLAEAYELTNKYDPEGNKQVIEAFTELYTMEDIFFTNK
mgnify:CR=1 FL=1